MPFAHRAHRAFVNLNRGESMQFALPQTTGGVIIVRPHRITFTPPDQPGDHSAKQPPRVDTGAAINRGDSRVTFSRGDSRETINLSDFVVLDRLRQTGFAAFENSVSFMQAKKPVDTIDTGVLDPGFDTGISAAPELTLELIFQNTVVQPAAEGKPIVFDSKQGGEFWSLRVTRRSDGPKDRRRYSLEASYPSVLPLLDRRVSMAFLQRGFELNWNRSRYLEMLHVENRVLQYRWNAQFSALYDLVRETTVTIVPEGIDFPAITATAIELRAGAADVLGRKIPFIGLHIKMECLNSTEVELNNLLPNVDLPRSFFVDLQLQLNSLGGIVMYTPRIETSLVIDVPGPDFIQDKVNGKVRDGLREFEQTLARKQWGVGRNFFDDIFRPWFVGHFEVVQVDYDEARDEMVIWHVGRPLTRQMAVAGEFGTFTPLHLPKLFADAEDERFLPPPFIDPLPIPPAVSPGTLGKVDHIVVLMQENRSFDQVLGYLSRNGHPELGLQADVDGLLPGDNARDLNQIRLNEISAPTEFRSRRSTATNWPFDLASPCHSRDCVQAQMVGGMKSFVANYRARLGPQAKVEQLQRIMDYHGAEELPVYAALAREFAICDHWFGSHIGGTLPNRHVTLSGDLNRDRNNLPEEENSDFNGYAPSERLTIFDHLTARKVSWRVFEHGYSFLRLYRNFTFDTSQISSFEDKDNGFERMALDGRLPSVTFIEPDYIELPGGNDDHAPADMADGQKLVARIVRAMIRGGQWGRSMLIITYDEHGGFYDHLIPPDKIEIKGPGGKVGSRPIPPLSNGVARLGPRVPAFVVSPLVARDPNKVNVSKTVFEHASIPATILKRFCAPRPPQMSPRVNRAADLGEFLTLAIACPQPDFERLLQILDPIATRPNRVKAATGPGTVPFRKLPANADPEALKEDFHGFIAYASSITGRRG